jgi:hypothetical protein
MSIIMKNINRYLTAFFSCTSLFILNILTAQEQQYIAVIPPFQDRMEESHTEGSLQLVRQQFVLFVYQDAVAVYSEGQFKNTGTDTIVQELALPSTNYGFDNKDGRISNGILGVQLRIEGEKVQPKFLIDGDDEWYTIDLELAPAKKAKVVSMFWVQTSLTDVDSIPGIDTLDIPDGKREFMIDLSHAAIWNGFIGSIDVTVVLKDGLTIKSKSFNADPDTYDLQDSTLTWQFNDIEPSYDDNISVLYSSSHKTKAPNNTMSKLSRYITSKVYDDLLYYVNMKQEK